MKRMTSIFLAIALLVGSPAAFAMNDDQQKEFDRILKMKMAELTEEAVEALEKKYPGEDWEAHSFPQYVYTNESVEVGYMIAVKEPDLLGNPKIGVKESAVPCYCFCDAMGHKSLLYCFWKDGKAGGEFDDHAAACNICYGQAMLAFLWSEIGASAEEILAGMEKKFEWLLKKQSH